MSNNTIQNFSEEDIKNFSQMKSEMYRIATSMKAYRNAKRFETLFRRCLRAGYPVDFSIGKGDDTLLYTTLESGMAEVVKMANILIEAGADVNHENFRNENALMLASRYSYGYRATENLIPVLLPLTKDLECKNKFGETALMLFCQRVCIYSYDTLDAQDTGYIKQFLDAGANIDDLLDPDKWKMSNTSYWKRTPRDNIINKRIDNIKNFLLKYNMKQSIKAEMQSQQYVECFDYSL